MRPGVQSKECQKAHWKALHKTTCSTEATIRENLKETPEEKEWSRKVTRWMNAWTHAISLCAPTALDLVNHEWGHHETHRYALLYGSGSPSQTQSQREVSSCLWNPPVLVRTANCFGSGDPNYVLTLPLLLNSATDDGCVHQRNREFAHKGHRTRGVYSPGSQTATFPLLLLLQLRGSHQAAVLPSSIVVYGGSPRALV